MRFQYLNLKKIRENIVTEEKQEKQSPGRRNFVKAMGLGALAWNPVVESVQLLSRDAFQVKKSKNKIQFFRQRKLCWEISETIFSPGYHLKISQQDEHFTIKGTGLNFWGTNLKFSLDAEIFYQRGDWLMDLKIPELGINQQVNFLSWLKGNTVANGKVLKNGLLTRLNEHDSVHFDGMVVTHVNREWQLVFEGKDNIGLRLYGKNYTNKRVILVPAARNQIGFLNKKVRKGTILEIPKMKGWSKLAATLKLNDEQVFHDAGRNPKLKVLLSDSNLLWITNKKGKLAISNDQFDHEKLEFNKYFFYAEYLDDSEPKTYFSASLPKDGQWFSTKLGSFKLKPSNELPDFEAYGVADNLYGEVIEPRLHAFQSHVANGISLTSVFKDSPGIRIKTQEPIKKVKRSTTIRNITLPKSTTNKSTTTQEPVRKVPLPTVKPTNQEPIRKTQVNQPQLTLKFDKIKFRPRRALTIRVMRPEDMILLEFEFHNFNYTNKGQSPFLELDNSKKNGIVVIYFTTQHTLEEAFFESNQIPGTGTNTEVKLPVKHLRARRSRLVYELPAGSEGFPVIMEELLDWSKFRLKVNPRAWIKIPQITRLRTPMYFTGRAQTIQKPTSSRFLDTDSKDYAIKLVQKSKVVASKRTVYEEAELAKVLQTQEMQTVKPAFSIAVIKNISLKVEPIPDFDTSIEAPTLMYISPNQTNDFFHQKELQFRDTEERKIQNKQTLSTEFRVLDPLSTNKGQVTELWHTTLGVRLKNGQTTRTLSNFKTIRALWADEATPNYKDTARIGFPFMASLDASDRHILVHTTSNYTIPGYSPKAVPVKNLMLTSLGAYLDWHAFFDVPSPADTTLNIIEWEHLATLGRDHYVKVVREGYLFPFGHRAALVKVTERKFHQPTKSAVNRQRMYIVVLEKEVLYSRTDPNNHFIEFPFQAVRINVSTTPDIDNPADSTLINVPSQGGGLKRITKFSRFGGSANTSYNFYINVGNKGFPFEMVMTDKEGVEHFVRMPLVFVENLVGRTSNLIQQLINVYNPNKDYTETSFSGQNVAYAESLVDGDTAFETEWLNFGGQVYPAKGEADIKFHPMMQEAKVFIKQLDEMTGIRKPARITLEDDQNAGMVFAKVADAVVDFSGGSDKAGGFLSPNMAISALSKLQGPVGGEVNDIKNLTFNPDKFFEALEDFPVAKIFGVIKIFDLLLGGLNLNGAFDGLVSTINQVKKDLEEIKNDILYLENLAKETKQNVEDQINNLKQNLKDKVQELLDALNGNIPKIPNFKTYVTTEAFYAEYKWQPEFEQSPIKVIEDLLHVTVDDPNKALTITTKLEKPFDVSKPAKMNGSARFEKFGIDIVPLLAVNFNYLEFKTGSSEKTDVKVDIDKNNPIAFKGVLSFVNNLQSVIPSTGFSDDGPYIKLSPTQVVAGFDISIPNVEVGICMISNMSLGANVTLPFTGAPLTMGFNFCKRENPFLLTISCFGGGGFFMMVTTLKGLQSIEAAFEFGAAMSLNVGVASGGVSAMGGFYYKMELVEKTINGENEQIAESTLTGYLRINGHLSILGLITVSLEFYLAFTAVFTGDKVEKLEGVATLKVKVEVLFFSKTVSVTVRRELKGADADPKFIEMIDQDDWQEYCLAFAS